ncbi:hypothetical protein GCM10012275_57610 [Longimycelium tulufanense]|uniref:Uncharacterized protein n=1 Tax=Longimycelium tulufanense TaxID=907463 RepID=A0A8J3CI72_9PSEU|nr:hypothetical protein [Longimycelium tulufanense]GGM79467.1 hypothetical protein GCM10012275_57610 [Longimycelium tulufanense]
MTSRQRTDQGGASELGPVITAWLAVLDQQRAALREVARVHRRLWHALRQTPGTDQRLVALAAQQAQEASVCAQRTDDVEELLRQLREHHTRRGA